MPKYDFRCPCCEAIVPWNGDLEYPPICETCQAFFERAFLENAKKEDDYLSDSEVEDIFIDNDSGEER